MTNSPNPVVGLSELIERVEKAAGPSEELSARVMCATAAPPNSYVEKSPFNGVWCIYEAEPGRSGQPRLWEKRGWHRPEGWHVTASLDAALALVGRVLPDALYEVKALPERLGHGASLWSSDPTAERMLARADAANPALALCLALLRALEAQHAR